MSTSRTLVIYLYGFMLVFVQALGISLVTMWILQTLALSFGETYDWAAVLTHLFLMISFAAFFPGQTFWTFRMRDGQGACYTIIGREDAPPD